MDIRNFTLDEHLGYAWLQKRLNVQTTSRLSTISMIGKSRSTKIVDGFTEERYPSPYRTTGLKENITFALKHEGINLEFLSRMYEKMPLDELCNWVREEPLSQYARRAGFFYEWLTGKHLDVPDTPMNNYIEAVNREHYLCASKVTQTQNKRWRIYDNLPGTPDFCPMIRLTESVKESLTTELNSEINRLAEQYGQEMILRSVNWLTIKESKASFEIEREGREDHRIRRFASAMTTYCGKIEDPLSQSSLLQLQDAILGGKIINFEKGLRRSPVFVGHQERYTPVVDYIAPHYEQITPMLEGLRVFSERTVGQNSILRATALSFGFVYIHPMADGNGRLSRFLINDTLRRDGVIPEPLILPVSAIISSTLAERARYDKILEQVSTPLMQRYKDNYSFSTTGRTKYEDGVESDFVFNAWDDAAASWRYLDLTKHADYTADIIQRSISEGIGEEAKYLQQFDNARQAINNIAEIRQEDADAIIRSIEENNGGVSNKLRKNYPAIFEDEKTSTQVVNAILHAFSDAEPDPDNDDFVAEPPQG